ncbi:hypothetical protein KJ840_02400 [Patescibacteria group bacterium]|nr:hypothetical protein [Patescibacteria group bacterium]
MKLSSFKINKQQLPKIVQHWSLLAFFVTPVFTIGNKLWPATFIYLGLYSFIFLTYYSSDKINHPVLTVLYPLFYIFYLAFIVYLVLYGRAMVWQKLNYQNTEQDIVKFKKRQKILMYIAISLAVITSVIFYIFIIKYIFDLYK